MPNLSDIVASGSRDLQYASIALSAAANTNGPVYPVGAWVKVPFNAKFEDTNNFCTLNTSTSSFTLPQGLYQVSITIQAAGYQPGTGDKVYSTRLRVNDTKTATKWPANIAQNATTNNQPGSMIMGPTSLFLSGASNVSLEHYWNAAVGWQSLINDADYNIFTRVDIWKLK